MGKRLAWTIESPEHWVAIAPAETGPQPVPPGLEKKACWRATVRLAPLGRPNPCGRTSRWSWSRCPTGSCGATSGASARATSLASGRSRRIRSTGTTPNRTTLRPGRRSITFRPAISKVSNPPIPTTASAATCRAAGLWAGTGLLHVWRNDQPLSWEISGSINSYTERSPSTTGLRALAHASLTGLVGRNRRDALIASNGHPIGIECYDSGRYLTFTGCRLPDSPCEILERQDAVVRVHHMVFGKPTANGTGRNGTGNFGITNEDILRSSFATLKKCFEVQVRLV